MTDKRKIFVYSPFHIITVFINSDDVLRVCVSEFCFFFMFISLHVKIVARKICIGHLGI